MNFRYSTLAIVGLLTAAASAAAEEHPTAPASPALVDASEGLPADAPTNQLDIELDPLAFATNGFSVHGGWRIDHWRIDIGAFGAELPSFLLSNDAFSSRFAGFGTKLDYHLNDSVGGAFFGVAASRVSNVITHEATSTSEVLFLHELSARVGYEFDLSWGLYLVPWVSVGVMLGSEDVSVDGDTLEAQGLLSVFPTIHLGYRL